MASAAVRFDMVPFEFSIEGLQDPTLRVLEFSGQEALSTPYAYEIDLISEDDGLTLEDLVGKPATLRINDEAGQSERFLHGVVASFLHGESSERYTRYRARVVPMLQLLSYRQDCRIFQNLSVPDILQQVFDGAGLSDYKLTLRGTYEPRVYCVQYRESDLNFVTRLMEDEGIYYFFAHSEGKSTLTLIDDPASHPKLPGGDSIEHHDTGGGIAPQRMVYGMRWQEVVTTNAVTLRDFDFERPSVDHLHLDKQVDQPMRLEQYDYPGIYTESGLGDQRVGARLDALQAKRRTLRASTSARHFLVGHRFTLQKHANDRFNREYTITSVAVAGRSPQATEQDQGGLSPMYSCEFGAAPSNTVLRSAPIARRPRVDGVQTAIIVGPAGEEVYTDEYGRVKVQFHWDRLGTYSERSSCWIRVSQLWAGASWGGMDIPRIGHEVVISFEEGDPDRPMIIGRVYHGQNRPPYGLPEHKVKSTIKSNSSPGGGGFNELMFDDSKGNEEVFLHSQKNTTIKTLNDKNQNTGNDETLEIGNNRTKSVGVDETTTVGSNRTEEVGKNEKISIGESRTEEVGTDETITIKRDRTENVGRDESIEIAGTQEIQVGKEIYIDAGDQIILRTGDAKLIMKSDGTIALMGKNITIKGSGEIDVRASNNITMKGRKILQN
ncbi:MAG: type VI secretion system Vgr family protein [Pseudomonadota bacterium]